MPDRSKRFFAGLLTGYGSIVANVVFTMTSIPLALHYLDKEHFGLWALALQINGYLALIDLGMSSAVSRFIADYKDEVNGGEYGSHLVTGGLVFLIQGFLIGMVGIGFSWFAPQVFAIPSHLAGDFRYLLMVLSATTGASVALRSLSSPLWAFQRNDVVNACGSLGLFITLGLLWLGFHLGWGVMSFAVAQIPVLIATLGTYTWICRRNHYYPSRGHWGKPSLSVFKHIFHFGKDNLLITLGSQLINASQIMIISRVVGLEAAATFSVGTKFYTMAMLLVTNPVSASASGLTELYVRGEKDRFVRRYWDLITLTLVVATVAATCLAVGNRSLISIWTHGRIQWDWTGDMILAFLIVLRNINGCFIGLFGITKNWRPVRHICLAEGIAFVPLAIFLAREHGIAGVLLASLIAHVLVTSTLSARAAGPIIGSWIRIRKSLIISLLLITGSATLAWLGVRNSISPLAMLATTIVVAAFTCMIAWFYFLPTTIKDEIKSRLKSASYKLRRKNKKQLAS